MGGMAPGDADGAAGKGPWSVAEFMAGVRDGARSQRY